MIRNENVTVHINKTQIYPDRFSMTLGVGKGYNTCEISGTNLSGEVGETCDVKINDDIYTLLVTEKEYAKNNSVTFSCCGFPYTLDNQASTDAELYYLNSDDLINGERGDIEVDIQIPNIDFKNQAYSKENTPLGRISDMAEIVGGEIYETGGKLVVGELNGIPENPTIAHAFSEGEVITYSYSDNVDKTEQLKEVLINPRVDDLTSISTVKLEYNSEASKNINIFFNPSLSTEKPYSAVGINGLAQSIMTKVESISIDKVYSFTTIGGVDSINYIKINGFPITDYVMYDGYNVVRLLNEYTGTVAISYKTQGLVGNITQNTNFIIKYDCAKLDDTIEVDSNNTVSSQNCSATVSDKLTYEHGGTVTIYRSNNISLFFVSVAGAENVVEIKTVTHSGGGTLKVYYAHTGTPWSDTDFMQNISSYNDVETKVVSGTVEYDETLDIYKVDLDMEILSINDILSGSVGITNYGFVNGDNPYVYFEAKDVDRNVDISVQVETTVITIPAPQKGHIVNLMDAVSCGGITTTEFIYADDSTCSIPATFKIDIASQLNTTISKCMGKTLTGDFGNLVVDSFGKVTITVATAALFTIYCDDIKYNAKITVDSREVTGA